MKDFTTFVQLKELSTALSSQANSETDVYSVCWKYTDQLVYAIRHDINLLFDTSCYVTKTRFIIGDPSYRQSASVVKLEIRFEKDKLFILMVESLIDFGAIWLRVRNRLANNKYDYIADRIEQHYNFEFLADIKQINGLFNSHILKD